MDDPRAENCKAFKLNENNRVSGVELQVISMPSTIYELIKVELIDEEANGVGGPTVATYTVLDKNNIVTGERVYLSWPFPDLKYKQLSGNPNNQHMITNGYNPPDIGPLALFVGNSNGDVISDIIGGLGLPDNHHISYRATWRVRNSAGGNDDDGNGGSGGTIVDSTEVLVVLNRIAATLDNLATHLGAV